MTANHFHGELPTIYPPNVASLNFDYNEVCAMSYDVIIDESSSRDRFLLPSAR